MAAAICLKVASNAMKSVSTFKWKTLLSRGESPLAMCTVNLKKVATAGEYSTATVNLLRENGTAYSLKVGDHFSCMVTCESSPIPIEHTVEPTFLVGQIRVRVSFFARLPGKYSVDMKINGVAITRGPASITYIPGTLDVLKSELTNTAEPKIVTQGVFFNLNLIPRDSYGNTISNISENHLLVDIRKSTLDGKEVNHELVVQKSPVKKECYELCVKLRENGHFLGRVKYDGRNIGPPGFTIICFDERTSQAVRRNVARRGRNMFFNAKMMTGKRSSKVRCFITPKALDIRQYRLGFMQQRVYMCRVSPTNKIILHAEANLFTVDNNVQEPIQLSSPDRCAIAAMFSKFTLQSVGGSECFKKKQQFFYDQLKDYHNIRSGHRRERIQLRIQRQKILKSAMKATKNFSASDWKKKIEIIFVGEDAVDFGGVSREAMELLNTELFSDGNGYFIRLNEDNQQAPVHPNHANVSYKCFEFAGKIVGKCIFECACNNMLLVKARFTHSFLAQLLGLKVHYGYYETDDPVYFQNKIEYTLQRNVTDDSLFYTDTAENVPLVSNGQRKRVTEENKEDYLNALAWFRLATKPSKQIQSFIKGLTALIPCDILQTIFTASELELLMCGAKEISYKDMKKYTDVEGIRSSCTSTLTWFWSIIEHFTQEERGKLLQFVTGSSVLPQGGFRYLSPPFTISMVHDKGRLPSAHTCINQLYLPEFNSYKDLHTSLMTALMGTDGFQLC